MSLSFNSKKWAQRNTVLSDLNEESPNKADKGKEAEGHSVVLEKSSKEPMLNRGDPNTRHVRYLNDLFCLEPGI
jgi:hypothetical protein